MIAAIRTNAVQETAPTEQFKGSRFHVWSLWYRDFLYALHFRLGYSIFHPSEIQRSYGALRYSLHKEGCALDSDAVIRDVDAERNVENVKNVGRILFPVIETVTAVVGSVRLGPKPEHHVLGAHWGNWRRIRRRTSRCLRSREVRSASPLCLLRWWH